MRLNIFTNCSDYSPSIDIIKKTYLSFIETFGPGIKFDIYLDPNPHKERADEYMENLERYFKRPVILTKGLADGYVKSIRSNIDDYMFQLEYDWSFQNINHSLADVVKLMNETGVYNFRFNKSTYTPENYTSKFCSLAIPKEHNGIKYLETDCMSNNPHIINREYYEENIIKHIDTKIGKSFGMEEILNRREFRSNVYGSFGDEPCIKHLTKLTKKV
jgi:hypothetical protein